MRQFIVFMWTKWSSKIWMYSR